jgi:hypothetical protein
LVVYVNQLWIRKHMLLPLSYYQILYKTPSDINVRCLHYYGLLRFCSSFLLLYNQRPSRPTHRCDQIKGGYDLQQFFTNGNCARARTLFGKTRHNIKCSQRSYRFKQFNFNDILDFNNNQYQQSWKNNLNRLL